MSSSKNLYTKKTSFLNKSNSAFIEQMYIKFINKDPELPQSWKDYFKDPDYKFLVDENHRLEQQYLEVMADNKKLSQCCVICC